MKVIINKNELRDKILACWIGKNIGGTMGTPYEGKKEILDISGFITAPGVALGNDDLDLQLVWLKAMEEHGPLRLSPAILADYWVKCIPPFWNEYGTAKANIKAGILPPLSGELNNERWKNSNGAWIRSEIWACLAPGYPNLACKFAFMDASVDHGYSEGTVAEIFTASMESYAFFEKDLRKLIDISMKKIPSTSRLYKSIRIVIDAYDSGKDWKTARNLVVEDSADLGWFQAPANVAFVILGLLYGEGDFKKSMITAINCGDDTDCTGATIGAIMGIMGGTDAIPADWREHIGDNIVTVAISNGVGGRFYPTTCTEFTDRIIRLIPEIFRYYDFIHSCSVDFEFTDGKTEYYDDAFAKSIPEPMTYFRENVNSYMGYDGVHERCYVEYDGEPRVKPESEVNVNLAFENKTAEPMQLHLKVYTPDGWTAEYPKTFFLLHNKSYEGETDHWTNVKITIRTNGNINNINRCAVEVTSDGRANVDFAPIVLLG